MSSPLSREYRRIITTKRNKLPDLFRIIDDKSNEDITELQVQGLKSLSLWAISQKHNLMAIQSSIEQTHTKWQDEIASLKEDDRDAEYQIYDAYFDDTSKVAYPTVSAIVDEITDRLSTLNMLEEQAKFLTTWTEPTAPQTTAPTAPPSTSEPTHGTPVSGEQSVTTTPPLNILPTLPQITMPRFNGKTNWEQFWSTFSDVINCRKELNDSTKQRYFEGCLSGEALELYRHYETRGYSYSQITSAFVNEFKDSGLNRVQLIREIKQIKPKSDSIEDQLKAVRSLETLVSQLKKVGEDPDSNHILMIEIIERFSYQSQKLVYLKDKEKSLTLSESLSILRDKLTEEQYLRDRCKSNRKPNPITSNTPVHVVSDKDKVPKKPNKGERVPHLKETNNTKSHTTKGVMNPNQVCIFCGKHKNSISCRSVKQTDKRQKLLQESRCLKCYQRGHPAEHCTRPDCDICQGPHHISICSQFRLANKDFKNYSPKEFVPKNQTSFNSTPIQPPRHVHTDHRQPYKHHTSQSVPNTTYQSVPTTTPVATSTTTDNIRMLTGRATLANKYSSLCEEVDVFLDCGSAVTLISSTTRDQLSLPTIGIERLNLTGLGARSDGYQTYDVVSVDVHTHNGVIPIKALVHDDPITGELPLAHLSTADKQVLSASELTMADSIDRKTRVLPKLLIGGQYYYQFTGMDKNKLPSGLYYVTTALGTMIAGETANKKCPCNTIIGTLPSCMVSTKPPDPDPSDTELKLALNKFLSMEATAHEDTMTTEKVSRKEADERVRRYFLDNLTFKQGSFYARYAFTSQVDKLGDGFNQAWVRLKQMHKKIGNDPEKLQLVDDIFKKQLQAGQIELVPNGDKGGNVIRYIPMQLVVKESSTTTPYRVVIDASAHSKDEPSLNDCLEGAGANLLEEIPKMLLRISLHKVLLAGDIEKAFLQIKIHEDQRDLLRVLWLKNPLEPPTLDNLQIMRYATAAFGIKQSPYLLLATLHYHANRRLEQMNYFEDSLESGIASGEFDPPPDYEEIIEANSWERGVLRDVLSNCYVDNIFFYCDHSDQLKDIFDTAKEVFSDIGMNIRAFFSSNDEFTRSLSKENGDQGPIGVTKILGVSYDTSTDTWIYSCNLESQPQKVVTKRIVLSKLASIFNPLGHLVPLLLPAKCFIQKLFERKYKWDDPLEEKDLSTWNNLVKKADLAQFSIPRVINSHLQQSDQFHMALFTDASHAAMGAVVYIWSPEGSRFLMARNQLAPAKAAKTTPKLELQALVMGMRLLQYVTEAISEYTPRFNFRIYTDATTVLQWLRAYKDGHADKYGVYVTNRLKQILELEKLLQQFTLSSSPISYDHVPGTDNPADHATRGLTSEELSDPRHIWWTGPHWLSQPPDQWYHGAITTVSNVDDLIDCTLPVNVVKQTRQHTPEVASPFEFIDVSRYSSLSKIKRIGSYICRFIKLKCPSSMNKLSCFTSPTPNSGDPPTAGEMKEVMTILLRQHQSDNIDETKNLQEIDFGLMVDEQGLIRVISGRVDNALIPESAKRPILIFKKDRRISDLMILDTHQRLMHRGAGHVLNTLRQEYWLIHGNQVVKSVIHRCITCKRNYNAPYPYPPAPPLPPERVQDSRPFQHIGLDFLGPLKVTIPPHKESTKAYVLLCTCMSTRLVHLEVTLDLSTSSFLYALERFISTRGVPDSITSDNAPAFKLADRILVDHWKSFQHDKDILSYVADREITWRWITPYAPWQGGFYERLVGSVKSAFNSVYSRRTLSIDEFNTQMKKIEAILNSRPLTHLNSDFSSTRELAVLRPCDFISPRVKLAVPYAKIDKTTLKDPDYVPPEEYNSTRTQLIDRYNKMEENLNKFWDIFRSFYLTQLREHHRVQVDRVHGRTHRQLHPQPGEIVLIVDEIQARGSWKMARVMSVHDRSVKLLSANQHIIHRPLNKIVSLELISSIPPEHEQGVISPFIKPPRPARQVKNKPNYVEVEVNETSYNHRTCSVLVRSTTKRVPAAGVYPWTWKYMLMIMSFTVICSLPVTTANRVLCDGNNVFFHHSNDFPPYQICGGGECHRIQPLNTSTHESTRFRISNTIHGFLTTVKYIANGTVHQTEEVCPPYDFCENLHCTFCLESIANPECSPYTVLSIIGLIFYLISLCIYACCCRPLILGKPIKSTCHFVMNVIIYFLRLLFRCVLYPFKCFRTTKPTRPIPQGRRHAPQALHRRRSYFPSLSILIILIISTDACQETIHLSSISTNCDGTTCKEMQNMLLKVNSLTREACVVIAKEKSIAGEIKLTVKSVNLHCISNTIGYHRDVEVRYIHAKRCPRTGSCIDEKCGNITSTSMVEELQEGNVYPGHTHCEESCGGPGCDCFFLSSGCLFYRTFVVPRSSILYQTFDCPQWRPQINIEIAVTYGNATSVETVNLTPNERTTINGNIIELSSFSTPPIPLLSKKFIVNQNRSKVGLLKHEPITECESDKAAKSFKCISHETCSCATTERAAVCECSQVHLEDNFAVDNVLPLLTPMMTLLPYKVSPVATLHQFATTELALSIDTSKWQIDHFDSKPIQCAVSSTPLVGCYSCIKGARTTLYCISKDTSGLATVKCGKDSFTIPCSTQGMHTERAFEFEYASILQKCDISCGDSFEIHGVLKYTGDLTHWNSDPTLSISWNDTSSFVLPDLGHFVNVFVQHWYSTIITVVIVCGFGIFTVFIIIPLLAGIWQCQSFLSLFRRRRSHSKIPQKEL